MNQLKGESSYCSDGWSKFWTPYNSLDVYIVPVVCAFGCLTNILNIIVFTRKCMRNPTNFILTCLSFVNFLSLFATFLYRIFNVFRDEFGIDSFFFAVIVQFGINRFLYHLFHSWSIFVTLLIALWRFLGVLSPMKSVVWFTQKNARLAVLFTIISSSLLIPFMFIGLTMNKSLKIENNCFEPREKFPQLENSTKTQGFSNIEKNSGIMNDTRESALSLANLSFIPMENEAADDPRETEEDCQYFRYIINQDVVGSQLYLWIWGILIELVPCLLLTFLTVALIFTLTKARQQRRKLRSGSGAKFSRGNRQKNSHSHSECSDSENEINDNEMEEHLNLNKDKKTTTQPKNENENDDGFNGLTWRLNTRENEKEDREFHHTTKMLIAILLLFLCSEFPFAVFSVVNALILVWPRLQTFYFECYSPLILFCDLNIYFGMSFNFFIYFKMSTRFRSAFRDYTLRQFCATKKISTNESVACDGTYEYGNSR